MKAESNDVSCETADVIDKIGLSVGQCIAIMSASGIFFLEGLEIMQISLLQRVVGPFPVGLTTAWTTGGTLVGVFAGVAMARWGRPVAIFLSYIMAAIAVGAMSLVSTHSAMCFLLALLGFSIGMAYPAAFSLLHELCPKKYRFAAVAVSFLSYGIGSLVAATTVHYLAEDLSSVQGFWRQVLWYSSLGASVLLLLTSFFSLWESPQFLIQTKQIVLAKDTLTFFLRTSFLNEEAIEAKQGPLTDLRKLAVDRSGEVLASTVGLKEDLQLEYEHLMFASFATGFAANSCAFFAVLDEFDASHVERVAFLGWHFVSAELLGAAGLTFCLALCYVTLVQWQHKTSLSTALSVTAGLCACLTIVSILRASEDGLDAQSHGSLDWSLSSTGMSLLATICTHVAILLVLCIGMEMSSTRHRCGVVAACVFGSQAGKLLAILIDRYLLNKMDLRCVAFTASAALCFSASLTVACRSPRAALRK
mmetsp:Transcript_31400/g.57675  ORF Transcript_31400/g.57675 Transcript_31400/m.57675 type:complete len:477 (+) Transcript_31400:88-1518(+)